MMKKYLCMVGIFAGIFVQGELQSMLQRTIPKLACELSPGILQVARFLSARGYRLNYCKNNSVAMEKCHNLSSDQHVITRILVSHVAQPARDFEIVRCDHYFKRHMRFGHELVFADQFLSTTTFRLKRYAKLGALLDVLYKVEKCKLK